MLRQMRRIIQGLDLHITLEQLFMEFAESTGLEEAKQFAVVIEIVRSTGGNMVEILKRTMQHLKYKMDTEEEIRVLLSGKLFEKNIMLSMPFFILLYLRLANPKYVECFYNTILGHLVMSGMIGITVFCFFWSEKFMNIRFLTGGALLLNNIFVSWKQKIESRIISDLKSQYTESEEQIRQRKEQFLKKQKKIILIEIIAGAVFLAFLIIRAAFLQDDILLSRNSFGQGSKEVQLSLKKDDKKKEITYKLDEQKLSAEEESKVYIQFFKKLKKIMMKNNTSLKQIQPPLNLPDTVDGYPFEITYELAEDGYIRLDGSINEEEQAKLKRGETYRTYIVVTARYGEYRKSKKYEIRIVPKKNISQTNVFYKIQQYLKKEEQENRYSRDIKIPSVYKDIEITKRQENQGGISGILILFVTVCIFIPLHNYLKLQEEGKKCQEQAERDFPVIVHLLTLYMGAGLSFFSAVKRINQNYQKQRELDDSKKYAFEKMMRMEQQMSNGVSQREACQDWGMQFRTDSYQKLSLILIQSFTKGGREAAMLMEAEEREAFHKRIDRAKKEGEEASTRLLFPMILLLCQVMLLVMYPALTRFQGF